MKDKIASLLTNANDQPTKYQATAFWDTAIEPIMADLMDLGMENFRNWNSSQIYFVPTYGFPGNSIPKELIDTILSIPEKDSSIKISNTIDNFLNGYNQAFSDFRVVKAILQNNCPNIFQSYSESHVGNPTEQFTFEGRKYSRSSLNYLLGLSALSEKTDLSTINNVLEIGGGFGSLGEILFCGGATLKYCNLDIPPTCIASEYYLDQVLPKYLPREFDPDVERLDFESEDWSVAVLPNWKIEDITGDIDLFVNYISFQEMEPEVVENYINHVLRLNPKWILLRHIREGKQKKTPSNPVGVINPLTPKDYDNYLKGYEKVTHDCTLYGYTTADHFHSDAIIYKKAIN